MFNKITAIALLLLAIFLGPYFTILALNAVFGTGIVMSFWTWLSVAWLQALVIAPLNGIKQELQKLQVVVALKK